MIIPYCNIKYLCYTIIVYIHIYIILYIFSLYYPYSRLYIYSFSITYILSYVYILLLLVKESKVNKEKRKYIKEKRKKGKERKGWVINEWKLKVNQHFVLKCDIIILRADWEVKMKRLWEWVKGLFKWKRKQKPHHHDWLSFGSIIIREGNLIKLEFFGSDIDAINHKPRAIITYLEEGEVIEEVIEFEFNDEFLEFRDAIMQELDVARIKLNDGLETEIVASTKDYENEGKGFPDQGN